MTDPTTPTDQPDELSAIRARVDEATKAHLRDCPNCGGHGYTENSKREQEQCEYCYYEDRLWDNEEIPILVADSRRLLELLDERDAELVAIHDKLFLDIRESHFKHDDERWSLDMRLRPSPEVAKQLGLSLTELFIEAGAANYLEFVVRSSDFSEEYIYLIQKKSGKTPAEKNSLLSSEIESLTRQLAEARELMREWYDGLPTYDLAWLESLKTRVSNFLTNQYPDTHMKTARETRDMNDILSELKKPLTPDRIKEIRDEITIFGETLKSAPILSLVASSTTWAERCGQFTGELLHALARIEALEAAVSGFIRQYDVVEPFMVETFGFAQNHRGRYAGPNWKNELDKLRALVPPPPDRAQEGGANERNKFPK